MFNLIFIGAMLFIWAIFVGWVSYEFYKEQEDD